MRLARVDLHKEDRRAGVIRLIYGIAQPPLAFTVAKAGDFARLFVVKGNTMSKRQVWIEEMNWKVETAGFVNAVAIYSTIGR